MKNINTICLVQSAMILAAGRGERMRPLTDLQPKPMLPIRGRPMMQYHLEALKTQGFSHVVINHAWLGEKIESYFGNGELLGLNLIYSHEVSSLETAGGIASALELMPLLTNEAPYLFVINGDVVCNWDFSRIQNIAHGMMQRNDLAYLVMSPNPPHHPDGDFICIDQRLFSKTQCQSNINASTFAGIGVYHRDLFSGIPKYQAHKLAPILLKAMSEQRVSGELFTESWHDVGTPERYRLAGGDLPI